MYQQREPLYRRFADAVIDNNGTVDDAAETNNVTGTFRFPAEEAAREGREKENRMKVLVINGPNINMLGIREPEVYGKQDYEALLAFVRESAEEAEVEADFYQSNHEGDLVDAIQQAYGKYDGIVINPAAYTHTSIAILDALKAVGIPTVEVHISDVSKREDFRRISYAGMACVKTYAGLGFEGYRRAILYLKDLRNNR